ncbi:hypothetical protein RVM25_28655, partial [Enterobacter hormaechei subsp. xiangfangensis]
TDCLAANRPGKPHHAVAVAGRRDTVTSSVGDSHAQKRENHTFGWNRYTECNDIFHGKHVTLTGGFDESCAPGLLAGLSALP